MADAPLDRLDSDAGEAIFDSRRWREVQKTGIPGEFERVLPDTVLCTDGLSVLWLLAAVLLYAGLCYLAAQDVSRGVWSTEPAYDYERNACGVPPLAGRRFLYAPLPTRPLVPLCVEGCPGTGSVVCRNGYAGNGTGGLGGAISKRECFTVEYSSEAVFDRCIPTSRVHWNQTEVHATLEGSDPVTVSTDAITSQLLGGVLQASLLELPAALRPAAAAFAAAFATSLLWLLALSTASPLPRRGRAVCLGLPGFGVVAAVLAAGGAFFGEGSRRVPYVGDGGAGEEPAGGVDASWAYAVGCGLLVCAAAWFSGCMALRCGRWGSAGVAVDLLAPLTGGLREGPGIALTTVLLMLVQISVLVVGAAVLLQLASKRILAVSTVQLPHLDGDATEYTTYSVTTASVNMWWQLLHPVNLGLTLFLFNFVGSCSAFHLVHATAFWYFSARTPGSPTLSAPVLFLSPVFWKRLGTVAASAAAASFLPPAVLLRSAAGCRGGKAGRGLVRALPEKGCFAFTLLFGCDWGSAARLFAGVEALDSPLRPVAEGVATLRACLSISKVFCSVATSVALWVPLVRNSGFPVGLAPFAAMVVASYAASFLVIGPVSTAADATLLLFLIESSAVLPTSDSTPIRAPSPLLGLVWSREGGVRPAGNPPPAAFMPQAVEGYPLQTPEIVDLSEEEPSAGAAEGFGVESVSRAGSRVNSSAREAWSDVEMTKSDGTAVLS
ncbi:hypothetical protein DIPPA_10206 [Diplonema papillatum]|nr:hypothetical protein DIPPA_10206 [Diplonema papillatum]